MDRGEAGERQGLRPNHLQERDLFLGVSCTVPGCGIECTTLFCPDEALVVLQCPCMRSTLEGSFSEQVLRDALQEVRDMASLLRRLVDTASP